MNLVGNLLTTSLIGCCSTKSTRYVLFTEDINRGAVYVPKLINLLNLRFTRKNNLLKYIWNMLIVHAWIICMWQPSRELLLLRLMIYKTYWNFTEACISGSLVNIWLNRIARPTIPQTSIGSTKQQNRTTEIDITLIAYGNVELFTYTSFYGKNINPPQSWFRSAYLATWMSHVHLARYLISEMTVLKWEHHYWYS